MSNDTQFLADHVIEENAHAEQPDEQMGDEHDDALSEQSSASTASPHTETEGSLWEDEELEEDEDEETFFESALVLGGRLEAETLKELEKSYPSQLKPKRQGKHQFVESTHVAYVVSHEVLDGIFSLTSDALRHTDKDKLMRTMLTANHNSRPLSQPFNKYSAQSTDDRETDREIRSAFASGKPFSDTAVMRATQQFNLLCEMSESIPSDVFNVMIACYEKLKDANSEPAVPKATRAILTKVRTGKPHHLAKHHHTATKPHVTVPTSQPDTITQPHAKTKAKTETHERTMHGKPISRPAATENCRTHHRPTRPHHHHHMVV